MSLLFSFPEQIILSQTLAQKAGHTIGQWEMRRFPDDEAYVRILSDVRGKSVTILCSLDHPDTKTLSLIFLARTLKELGCGELTLIAPYLGYMRQDKRFHDGEAVTSGIYAKLLSPFIDGLITIDPHLHRIKDLEDIYYCECKVLSAAPLMAKWVAAHVQKPLIVGPDGESEQWARIIAEQAQAPCVIQSKTRHGDHDVAITLPDIRAYADRMPVLVDDIISTGVTMIKTLELLRQHGHPKALCLATHGLFAGTAYQDILAAGAEKIVTTNTIPYASNAIDIAEILARAD